VYIHWYIIYKCNIHTCKYGDGKWCQQFLLSKPRNKIKCSIFHMYFCHGMPWKNIVYDSMKKKMKKSLYDDVEF